MSVGLNAAQARAKASQDMIVFTETQSIMNNVIEESSLGNFETYVDDNTTMTVSTPIAVKLGTVNNPTITVGDTFIFNGVTVILGTTGVSLNAVISDINDAEVPGLVATKDNNYLVLTVELPAQAVWSYTIGAGTANAALGFTAGTYTLASTPSQSYFNVWQGTETDRGAQNQMEQVIRYFSNLGYKIERISNTNTTGTFKWHVYW